MARIIGLQRLSLLIYINDQIYVTNEAYMKVNFEKLVGQSHHSAFLRILNPRSTKVGGING